MNELQQCLYEMLCDIQDICSAHDIEFFLVEGNALGAKRHEGFIPWDDDLDIAMTRENYAKFKKVMLEESEIAQKYFYQDYKTDPKYPIPFAKVRKNHTVFFEEETKCIDMHQGVYIDVFPIDYLTNCKALRILQMYACQLYEAILRKNVSHNIVKRYVVKIIRGLHLEREAMHFFEKLMCNSNRKTSNYYAFYMCGEGITFRESQLFPARKVKFEGGFFPVFHQLEEYLEMRYGDYMQIPSEEQQEKSKHSVYYEL